MQRVKFAMALNIGKTNEERIEAFNMYQQAFSAVKLWESTAPGCEDIHIGMELAGINVLLAPGGKVEKTTENAMCCEVSFESEGDLRRSYDILSDGALSCSLDGPFPWAQLLGLVVDKFGVCWALYLRTQHS